MYDIIIKNGILVEPDLKTETKADVGINGRYVVKIGDLSGQEGKSEINADGCYVTPGLIDFHAHAFYGSSDFSMPADLAQLPSGVTSMVDAGSSGAANYETLYHHNINNSILTIKSFLNITSLGQLTHRFNENTDPRLFDRKRIGELCRKYKDNIIGLKLRQSRDIVGELGLEPLKETIKVAGELGLRVSVHATDSPGEVRETLELLRPGDIFCHVYHQKGKTILDESGNVLPEVWEARKKGVLFELGHGAFNFSGKIAKAAIKQGFLPDIISSDLSLLSMFKNPTYSFSYIMSELLNLGVDFMEILTRCITVPGKLMGVEERTAIKAGSVADIVILRIEEKEIQYEDRYHNHYSGDKIIVPELTIKEGMIVHRQYNFI